MTFSWPEELLASNPDLGETVEPYEVRGVLLREEIDLYDNPIVRWSVAGHTVQPDTVVLLTDNDSMDWYDGDPDDTWLDGPELEFDDEGRLLTKPNIEAKAAEQPVTE